MHFQIEQSFDAPLEAVEQALIDPQFLEQLRRLPKLGTPELLDHEVDGHLVRRQVRYRFMGDISASVRRVVDPDRLTWVEESTLDRRAHLTQWRILPDHYRHLLRCSGTFLLRDTSPTTTQRIAEGDIKVSVPLVGGKVESAIVRGLREHAQLEEDVLRRWLGKA